MQFFHKPLPGTQINLAHPLAKGIVGCWLMNEGGWRCYDLSPYKNHGQVYCADGGIRRSSLGIAFDGTDDYVNCGNGASLDITNAITIETLVKPSSFNLNSYNGIITKYHNNEGQFLIQTNGWDSNKVMAFIYTGATGNDYVSIMSNSGLSVNTLYHVVITATTSGNLLMYINGVLQSASVAVPAMHTTADSLRIGYTTSVWFSGKYFNGTIGLVRIWNRALLADEIGRDEDSLYNNPYGMFARE